MRNKNAYIGDARCEMRDVKTSPISILMALNLKFSPNFDDIYSRGEYGSEYQIIRLSVYQRGKGEKLTCLPAGRRLTVNSRK